VTGVSLVLTVKDEARTLPAFLDSLSRQTRRPDEVVVVDGGSRDGTMEVLDAAARRLGRFRVESRPGSTIAGGRNAGILGARGPIVAVTDAGTVLAATWLERLVAPFELEDVDVTAGYFRPGGASWLERTIAATITPHVAEVEPARFLPSSRSVAFRKERWAQVGGYPEWLRHCEDLVFDLALRDAGASFRFVPGAVVEWRARPSLGAFARQYYDYARGDGHADLWRRRHAVRYAAYALGLALLRAAPARPAAAAALAAGVGAHVGKHVRRVVRHRPFATYRATAAALAAVPLVVVTGDLAKMAGYPVGSWERLTRRVGRP
jgi:glycosyltransferase involved in cell wall biosynthesis